ncbi:hypothetical protein [Ideonella sp. A 288]|uniref:hypothetical protein n=1 Tax=Ideonella sp. A 288 TaxID=1962181 RepID=UPI0011861AD9|nr:hypothetical protein [Ideonella sp. A 288]
MAAMRQSMMMPVLAALALAGCGGGSGTAPADPAPATVQVTGLVADRSAWAGADLEFVCTDGQARRTQAASDGRYAIGLPAAALPCLVQATASPGDRLWSVAVAAGTVHVTPGSDWTVSRLLRTTTAGLRADRSMLAALSVASVAQAQADVRLALAASGLATDGDLVSTPAVGAADALLVSQQQVLSALSARDIGPLALRQVLALQPDMGAARDALAAGQLSAALALPALVSDDASAPHLVSGLVQRLTGPADLIFGVNAEGSWRSTDGGRQWTHVNHVLAQVVPYKGRLWARDLDGLVVSDDGGLHWTAPAGMPSTCLQRADVMSISAQGRLWFFPDTMCAGTANHFTDDGVVWKSEPYDEAVRIASRDGLADRSSPLRRVFFRDNNHARVTSCLSGSCVDRTVLDWPEVQTLRPVVGSGEVVAGLSDRSTGRPPSMALSSDGITWQAMGFMPSNDFVRVPQGGLLASPGGDPNAVPNLNTRVQRSDDNGITWRPSDPALNAVDGWLTLGADTRLRKAGAQADLSVDAGRTWRAVPEAQVQRDRQAWQRAPDGTLLRAGVTVTVQASTDGGTTWRDVLTVVDALGNAFPTTGPVWMGDRWAVMAAGGLHTSLTGLAWTKVETSVDGVAGPLPAGALGLDGGLWVLVTATGPQPTTTDVRESRDQGRTWTASTRGDAVATACGGLRVLWRPRASDGVPDWQVRNEADAAWRALSLPAGVVRDRGLELSCQQGLLMLRVAGRQSSAGPALGARGLSHWLTPDHGAHWFAVGRPGTDLFRVEGHWWSLGTDSVMLWP